MIQRIVKLSIARGHHNDFERFFNENRQHILAQSGCIDVQLFKVDDLPDAYMTISSWQSREHLEQYRQSDFFRKVWPQVKGWMSAKTEVWSLQPVSAPN